MSAHVCALQALYFCSQDLCSFQMFPDVSPGAGLSTAESPIEPSSFLDLFGHFAAQSSKAGSVELAKTIEGKQYII